MGDCPKITPLETLTGNLLEQVSMTATLRSTGKMNGYVRTAMRVGGTNVEFGTTEYWNEQTEYVPEQGTIIVYEDGNILDDVPYPTIKIADGVKTVTQLPYIGEAEQITIITELNYLLTELEKKINSNELATVATSGSYNDLTDKPTIPINVSAFINDVGYLVPDDVSNKMERVVLYLTLVNNSYTLRNKNNEVVSFDELFQLCRTESKYVVILMGNSKLRPQYVSSNEIHCDGEDRDSQSTMFLRMIMTSTTLYYSLFRLADKSDITNAINALANVARTGSYNDLEDKPTIPTVPSNVSSFENDAGYLTQHQPLGEYVKSADLSTVATSGSYNDLNNKPTNVSSFTNDSGYITEDDLPTKTSELQNDSGFLTQHQSLTGYVKNTDYASTTVAGVIKRGNWITLSEDGKLQAGELTKAQYDSATGVTFIGKTTLENVLAAKGYATESFVSDEFDRKLSALDASGVSY